MRLALQKSGRLGEESLALLKKAGFLLPESGRKLTVCANNFPLEILFLRAGDIAEIVADGVADIGIVGENGVLEFSRPKEIVIEKKLGFGKCRLSLAVPRESTMTSPADFSGKKIATGHKKMLNDFLKRKNISAETIPMSGSIEIAPVLGIADGICDLVSSGGTLAANNLREVAEVARTEAVLIGQKNAPRSEIFFDFFRRLESVLAAKALKSVIMNAPKESLKKIDNILPGLESPTVMPLARKNWVAIHSVVCEDEQFWPRIDALKKAGATGILVSPVDRVIF